MIVHEVERRRRSGSVASLEAIAEAVRRAVAEEHEVQVHEVVLIRQGGLPKTSSGKVQRRACRELYLAASCRWWRRSALAQVDSAPEIAAVLTRGDSGGPGAGGTPGDGRLLAAGAGRGGPRGRPRHRSPPSR